MLSWLSGKEPPTQAEARRLVTAVMAVARRPDLYGEGRVADTFDGRFELAVLHAILAMRRMRADPGVKHLAQAFSNILFRSFDEALREIGVGDLSVPKKMKKVAGAFYGRLQAYDAALNAKDRPALAEALTRNIWNGAETPFAETLAAYAERAGDTLAGLKLEALGDASSWPTPD